MQQQSAVFCWRWCSASHRMVICMASPILFLDAATGMKSVLAGAGNSAEIERGNLRPWTAVSVQAIAISNKSCGHQSYHVVAKLMACTEVGKAGGRECRSPFERRRSTCSGSPVWNL
eukprot:evm.model.scf_14.1 EVM.evm.TU.scf_14.1   scf_14:50017-50367(-)